MKFQKKWIESCDEMEQQMIYKAAFHAYKVTNYLCLTLWTGFTVLAVVLKISLWPVTIVSAIWLTMAVSYAAEDFPNRRMRQEVPPVEIHCHFRKGYQYEISHFNIIP